MSGLMMFALRDMFLSKPTHERDTVSFGCQF